MNREEQLGAIIYTSLLGRSKPCSLEEICQEDKGLRKRQERVARLLDTMVCNDMVVRVENGQYILKEKFTPALTSLTVSDEGGNTLQPATRALVPVQHMTVQTSSSSEATCDHPVLRVHTEHFEKILDIFRSHSSPIKAKDIAQWTGIGSSKSAVNRYLYCLKEHGVLQENGRAEWSLLRDVKGDDLMIIGAQLAKVPSKTKKADPPLGGCNCRNAGPTCVHNHVTNNLQQNIYHHHYYTQVGEHNEMDVKSPERGDP